MGFDLLSGTLGTLGDIPYNIWNRVRSYEVTIHRTESGTEFDVVFIRLSKINGNLGVIVEKTSCNICMSRVGIQV